MFHFLGFVSFVSPSRAPFLYAYLVPIAARVHNCVIFFLRTLRPRGGLSFEVRRNAAGLVNGEHLLCRRRGALAIGKLFGKIAPRSLFPRYLVERLRLRFPRSDLALIFFFFALVYG